MGNLRMSTRWCTDHLSDDLIWLKSVNTRSREKVSTSAWPSGRADFRSRPNSGELTRPDCSVGEEMSASRSFIQFRTCRVIHFHPGWLAEWFLRWRWYLRLCFRAEVTLVTLVCVSWFHIKSVMTYVEVVILLTYLISRLNYMKMQKKKQQQYK